MPDQQPTVKDPAEVLADRLSALDKSALRHFAYALAYAPGADMILLRAKVDEAERWSSELASDFSSLYGAPS